MRRTSLVQLALVTCSCSAPAGRDPGGSGEPRSPFWAVDTGISFDPVHVLDVERRRWDGLDAEVRTEASTIEVRATDEVGRDVRVSLDTGRHSAEFRRCRGALCDRTEATARPLWSGRDRTRGYALLGELDDASWSEDRVLSVAARDGLVALALGRRGLALIDASQPQDPRVLFEERSLDASEVVNDVEWLGHRWLLVASSTRGLRVLDLTKPSRPEVVVDAFPGGLREVHSLFLDGRICHAARVGPAGGLDVVDLGDPNFPRLVADLTLPGCSEVHEVHVSEGTLLASCLGAGLFAFDLVDPANPSLIAHRTDEGSHTAWPLDDGISIAATSEGFGGSLTLLELDRDAGSLRPIGSFSSGSAASAHEVSCRKSRCTVSYYQEGLLELDVSNRAEPRVRRRFPTWDQTAASFLEGASASATEGNLVFVADTTRGLLVLERE